MSTTIRDGSDRMPRAVALIPAREGSTRVPGKNVRALAGHPLIAYSIAAARESGVFDGVVVSTDGERTAEIARHYGADVPGLRPADLAGATSPDIEWVEHVLGLLPAFDAFAILRPTSPFRGAATIARAWRQFLEHGGRIDSIRAVEPCRQHPGKMWVIHDDDLMTPLLPQPDELPFHSRQYAALPPVHVQNSSLEMAWTRVVTEDQTIAGRRVAPFFTEGLEGFSIDYPDDFERAERAAALLPAINTASHREAAAR
jgi:CMP-N,N'-diacetyllegionaminic acid synthase